MKLFKKISFSDQALQQLQNNIEVSLRSIAGKEILDGVLVRDKLLTAGQDNQVQHGLGRAPLGWIVVNSNAQATVILGTTANTFPQLYLWLRPSATVTVSLWFF